MPGKTVAEKMFMKPGHRVAALNVPGDYAALVGALPEGAKLTKLTKDADFVHLFVRSRAELGRALPALLASIRPDALFWVAYPKKTSGVKSDITRDHGWEAMTGGGWEAVSQIAVDEVWSSLRFRPSGVAAKPQTGSAAGARADKPRSAAGATVKVPDDLAAALDAAPEAKARFARLPRSHRLEYVTSIEEAKRAATRAKRVAEAVKKLSVES